MKMKIFEKFRQRREEKRRIKELTTMASAFRTLDKIEASSLVFWDAKQRRLFIEQTLAAVMIRSAESWRAFINNCYLWLYYREAQQAWDDFILREELDAVRQAKKAAKGKVLSRQDIARIRLARRQEIAQSDMAAPKVKGFEFFVIRAASKIVNGQSSIVNDIVAVGHYDPETEQMELALWEEVRQFIVE